jgi:hypothetical protein
LTGGQNSDRARWSAERGVASEQASTTLGTTVTICWLLGGVDDVHF